jgi:membrane protein required for beta-lactamase induction
MRIGPLEIALIIIIVIVVALTARIIRIQHNKQEKTDAPVWQREDKPGKMRRYLKSLGVVLVLGGIIVSLAGISLFRWAVQSYIYALISIGLGAVLLLLARRN